MSEGGAGSLSLERCELCPRRCGVNRVAGEKGYCRAGARAEVFRYGPHHGEEPPLSGTRGSGTIFFSRCTLRCIYCQNFPWSQEGEGTVYEADALASVLRNLSGAGCHNWNLVSPTPWLPCVWDAVRQLDAEGIRLPLVYNTSGFERPEILHRMFGQDDVIFCTDLRYATPESALAGSGCREYVESARLALRTMWDLAGPLSCDTDGLAVSGTICRLLVLPGLAHEAIDNLEWLAETIGTGIAVSVMSQYTPAYKASGRAPWDSPVTAGEYEAVRRAVNKLGFSEGWVQEHAAETSPELLGFNMRESSAVSGTQGDKA